MLRSCRASLQAGDFGGTVVGEQMAGAGMPPDLAPAAMLAVMWAALANSVPAAFWSTAFLLLPTHAQHLNAVRAQLPRSCDDAEAIVQVGLLPETLYRGVTHDGLVGFNLCSA